MNVKMEKIETNVVKLEITVEPEKFAEAMKKSYNKNVKNFNIPGFRKGKAPMNIIKKYYGESALFEDAINFCCDATYPAALEENSIKPVDYPEIDIVQIGEGKEFIYTAKIVVVPEVKLGEYKGIEVKKSLYPVKEEEIATQIESMQQKNSRVEIKEDGTIEKGDMAIIDFKGYIDGAAFEGGEGTDFSLEIGSGTFIDTFEDQLIGLKKDESKKVNVSFPAEYGREDLNGKAVCFDVTVKEVKVKEVPALDDEFAKEVSEFDTIAELKADLAKKIEEANKAREEREYEDAVIDAVCGNATVEIPEVMVTKEVDVMIKDLEMRLKYQGLDLETYYQYTNNTEDKVREFMKETAEKRVKSELVITKIAKEEAVQASEEELREKAIEMAKQYGSKELDKTVELVLSSQKEYLKMDVVNEKVVKMLVDNSKAIA